MPKFIKVYMARFLAVALIIMVVYGSAYAQGLPLTFKDALGRDVTINQSPERIISLAPSNTQTLLALGLGDKIVGMLASDPNLYEGVTTVGDAFSLDLEAMVSLSPHLILAYSFISDKDLERLEALGMKVAVLTANTVEETFNLILDIGELTGTFKEAKDLVGNLNHRIDTIQAKLQGIEERPFIFYEAMSDNSGIWTTGSNTFQDDIIRLAGGRNAAFNLGEGWFALDTEKIISLDPQVYVAGEAPWDNLTVEKIRNRTGFSVLSAVKEDRVYLIEPDILSQPGPRVVEGIERLASLLYPHLFPLEP
jgi:iron complex transport system substrate-binding protein